MGPLSSIDGSRLFYVDMSAQLGNSEELSSIIVSSNDNDITISSATILNDKIATKDGYILPANQSIYFRASSTASKKAIVIITISYITNSNNSDSTIVYLRVVPKIL